MPDNATSEYYAIIVYGFVAEFMPISYRKAKHYDTKGKKTIKCPYCGGILAVVDVTDKFIILRYPQNTDVILHSNKTCGKCSKPVGIIYANKSA